MKLADALTEMRRLADSEVYHDIESDHNSADDILCAVLRMLGKACDEPAIEELVRLYEQVDKWYA